MAQVILSSNIAGNVKPCFASSAPTGLTLRCNGEEVLQVIDTAGNMFPATIPSGAAPTAGQAGGALPANQWATYAYVYAATTAYPFVENSVAIGGSVAPRGNPSALLTLQIGASNSQVTLTIPYSTRADIDQIWVFRTNFFTAQTDAQLNGQAGFMFYLGSIANNPAGGSGNYVDNNPISVGDQIEVDNFTAPNFQYCIYVDPYWWGWGNNPLSVPVTWNNTGALTLTGGGNWFSGRQGQFIRLSGVTTGGIDGRGTFIFKYLTATTGQLTTDGTTSTNTGGSGSGTAIIQGYSTTLYRSKRRNPFSWGQTDYIGTSIIPYTYTLKVGGGLGTAIGVIPTVEHLILSCEYPTSCWVLDLALAGTSPDFENSLKRLSKNFSITSHFSQFEAAKVYTLTTELREERQVLWGYDAKNFCIVEVEGLSIRPVSHKVSKTMRQLTALRSRQILAHGQYDAKNRLNCMWLTTANSGMLVNFLIAQHVETNAWYMKDEHDVMCSAAILNGDTGNKEIYVGTQGGIIGQAFVEGVASDWQVNAVYGTCTAGSTTTISYNRSAFLEKPLLGNWVLVTDPDGNNEQWARVSSWGTSLAHFDFVYSAIGGGTTFNPAPTAGWLWYAGLIECRALKYFDFNDPSMDKKLSEILLGLDGVDTGTFPITGQNVQVPQGGGIFPAASTFIRWYQDRQTSPASPLKSGQILVALKQVKFDAQGLAFDGQGQQLWFTNFPPTIRQKTFGLEIIDRGYQAWKLYSISLKAGP